jgi:uncharacterized OB-fold protein
MGPPKEVEGRTPHHRGQPSTYDTSSHDTADTEILAVRCRRCRRLIWAPRSVSRSCGPICWRQLRAEEELCSAIAQFADELAVAI